MSQENIEIVRPAVDAFDRGDRAAWLALPDEDYVCLRGSAARGRVE
jgi:ketosteroid isomerase-like protein